MRWSIGGSRVNIINCQSRETLVDAYVLCTTERGPDNRLEKMGAYCVRIDNAQKFFELTTVAMRAQREVTAEFMDYITYRERSYQGTETSPGHIGFIKPRDKYAEEREIRLLWEVRWELPLPPARLEPFLLQCPEVASLCTRID